MIQTHGYADVSRLRSLFAYNRRAIIMSFEERFGVKHTYRHRNLILKILMDIEETELATN